MGAGNSAKAKGSAGKVSATRQKSLFEMSEMFYPGEDTGAILPSDETGVNPLEVDTKEDSSPYGIFNRPKTTS